MIFRFTALLKSGELVEGWAHSIEEWREKLEAERGEVGAEAFLFTYGQEPHFLNYWQYKFLVERGFSPEVILTIYDVDLSKLKEL